jgi:hypothetical protein
MAAYTPEVKQAHAFREVSQDFTTPEEIFREAIANSLDAYAQRIWLRTSVEERRGRETVLIDLSDDGIGMSADGIKAFFNLSDSVKPPSASAGKAARKMTGYKGHGTKIYYNSELLEVVSYDGKSKPVWCQTRDPLGELSENRVPQAEIEEVDIEFLKQKRKNWGFSELGDDPGTSIRVIGYHRNAKNGLEHIRLRDHIIWFTRWGSWEGKLCDVAGIMRPEVQDLRSCDLYLRGLGKEDSPDTYEKMPFGHVFPDVDCTDVRQLRKKDEVDPLKYFVKTWAFHDVALRKNPDKRIDFLFAIEGEGARREYNDMLRRQRRARRPGDYLSEERYGLWLGRDFVPVQRFNEWVSERSEYTRMHAFVNCDDLEITANRNSVENTPAELLIDIEETVSSIFNEDIVGSPDYIKFQDEMLAIERHRAASKEGADYKRRLKRLESKEYTKIRDVTFYSPNSETDLIALVSGIQSILPDLLPFVVRDYDSHFGFDGLASRNKELAINETAHLFVEFKRELMREFNHSFDCLEAILCWNSRVKDGETVTDLAGKAGTYHITTNDGVKSRMIVRQDKTRNVEVIALKELLEQRGFKFVPVGE